MRTILSTRSRSGRLWMGVALIVTLAVGVVLGSSFASRSEAAAQPVTTFSGGAAMMTNVVDPSKTADFERVMRAYGEGLAGSSNAEYNRMAEGFKVYRAVEPGPNNFVVYYWFIDPVISGANYAVAKVLADEVGGGPPGAPGPRRRHGRPRRPKSRAGLVRCGLPRAERTRGTMRTRGTTVLCRRARASFTTLPVTLSRRAPAACIT